MYSKIEEEFIERSHLRTFQILVFCLYYVLAYVCLLCLPGENANYVIAFFVLAVITVAVTYVGVLIYLKVKDKHFSLKVFWHVFKVAGLFREKINNQDIKILESILKKNGIKSKTDLCEVLHHYQALLPRNLKAQTSWISVGAFAISIIALVLSDNFLQSMEYAKYASMIFVFIMLTYGFFLVLNTHVFQLFGKAQLYQRLESSIFEIYIKAPERCNRTISKKRKLRNGYDKHS